jgi:hypothetical protein
MKHRGLSTLDAAEVEKIRAQLARLLESPPFRSSRRCSDFLRHVVEKTCEGQADELKERTLGVAVFDREPDYDTNQDPVVRNTAGQVRKRLAQYYCEPGRDRELRIDLPPGAYVPDIAIPEEIPEHPPVEPTANVASLRPKLNRRYVATYVAAALAFVAVVAAAGWFALRPATNTSIEAFWAPVVNHEGAVIMIVGQGHAYRLTPELDGIFDDFEAGGALPQRSVPITDITPAFGRYVALTDTRSLLRIASVFHRVGKPIDIKGGRTASFADLRRKPIVLLGAFNNTWTLNLTGELRFYFESDPANKLEIVRDRQRPDHRAWNVRTDALAAQIRTDYAIVSRVFNPTTEQAVVVAAGIRGGGTAAAAELLTDEKYLAHALSTAPKNWAGKNAQFVLATKMIGGNPGPPTVIATHYW